MPRGGLAPERCQSHVGREPADASDRPAPYVPMLAAEDRVEFGAAQETHVVPRPDQCGKEVAEAFPAASGTLGPNRSGVVDPVGVDHGRDAALYEQACAGDGCIDTIWPNHRLEFDVARLPPKIVAALRTRAECTPLA
jgi:hypothetical protein